MGKDSPTENVHLVRREAVRNLLAFEELVASSSNSPFRQVHNLEDARASRQLTEYVQTCIRQRRYLDFVLSHFCIRPLDQVDPRLLQVLRVALCDIFFLGTPIHASIFEAVQIAKTISGNRAGGFVNGILRSVERANGKLPEPETGSETSDLGIRYSHPDWLVERWIHRFGLDGATALLQWNNRRPHYSLRVNSTRITTEDFVAKLAQENISHEESKLLQNFVRVGQLQPIVRSELLSDGLCSVQDESAGIVVDVLDPQPREVIVDLCSAPGGKTCYIAEKSQARVIAVDIDSDRLEKVKENATRLGLDNIGYVCSDAASFSKRNPGMADRVLVDAPCTGLGVMSKRSDLRWRRSPGEIPKLASLQATLLQAGSRVVKPGGVLVYATCSITEEENDQVAKQVPRDFDPVAVSAGGRVSQYFRSLPHIHGIDGAFAAKYVRQ